MKNLLVERKNYLNHLLQARDKHMIKVITGVRRCGKSTLLAQFQQILLSQGVHEEQILSIHLDWIESEPLLEYHALYDHIKGHLQRGCTTYIFLDEIQLVPDFQKAVLSIFEQENADIYLTGSNAGLLSGELATLLSGRYMELSLFPLSFAEYCELRGGDQADNWKEYFSWGGFPYLSQIPAEDIRLDYLSGIYHTVLMKDIMERRSIQDASKLKNVVKFMLDNIGNPTSAKKIADTLTSNGHKTVSSTIDQYLQTLCDAFILYPCSRYDIHGKQHLKTMQKYYTVDMGFRRLLLGNPGRDIGHILENIVFLELLRRGYQVHIGKIGSFEIDFIAQRGSSRIYYQVSASIIDPTTFQREIRPLKQIQDNYPKFILSLDALPLEEDGILQKNIIEWLRGAAHLI